MRAPAPAADSYPLASGVVAVAPGVAWLPGSRAVLVADAHLAYEELVGGALPLWSTAEIVATLERVARNLDAREFVFLGDIVHGAQMSEGASRIVRQGLNALRERCAVTLIAGNHEGRSRAFAVLGATVEGCERDGWLLVHGDGAAALGRRAIVGHSHPSLHLAASATAPAFVASEKLVVVPALNPYSPGLDVRSEAFARVLGAWNVRPHEAHVVGVTCDRVLPFGSLDRLAGLANAPAAEPRGPANLRRRLRPYD